METKEVEIEGEKIFLKRDSIFKDWKVVHPIKVNGKIVWKNLIAGGNWAKLIPIGIIVAVILLAIMEYSSTTKLASDCLARLPDYIQLYP